MGAGGAELPIASLLRLAGPMGLGREMANDFRVLAPAEGESEISDIYERYEMCTYVRTEIEIRRTRRRRRCRGMYAQARLTKYWYSTSNVHVLLRPFARFVPPV